MIVYRNPLPEQMGAVRQLRWDILRDPILPMDDTVTDEYDTHAATEHGALWQVQFGAQLLATGRIHLPEPGVGKIRFMATRMDRQGQGLGSLLLTEMESRVSQRETSIRPTKLEANARISALGFYEKLGYAAVGEEFELVGVPHVKIEKVLRASN